ncbi:MAG TPA: hypothetical protein VFS30_00985 [Dehalococcoidia bacterium]|nr:hypothetical protein [Dehalococcoidia bacterium]
MYDNPKLEGPGPAVIGLLAGIVLIGSAIGLFLLLGGSSEPNNDGGQAANDQRRDDEASEQSGGRSRERQPVIDLGDNPPAGSNEAMRCAEPDACIQPSPELLRRYPDATSCDWYERRVCIVPLGDVPVDLIQHLVDYYAAEYELEVRVLRPITLDEGLDTERPGQVEADVLRQYFSTQYFVYDRDLDAILIGLTPLDIYTAERPEWRWFFGQTYGYLNEPLPNQAIISFFRMDPVNWCEPEDVELRNRRVRTLMNKYVALTYYGLQLNDDPESVLYRLIGSVGALDRIDERIPLER